MAAAGPATAQTSLGGQRVATSSATFLKIGVDARGAALGGAYTALVQGPLAPFCNPAGIAALPSASAGFGYARWPADIDILAFSFARPWGEAGTSFGVIAQYVGTTLEETTEYHPQGTGRTFVYNDLLFGFSAARMFTDRLAIGATLKAFQEDLGSGVGGPLTQGWLLDAGTAYQIGARNGRLAISLTNFGPDLRPDGTFPSHVQGDEVDYATFSPPTSFRIGLSLEPYRNGPHTVTAAGEVVHVADNQESFRAGVEYDFRNRYYLRAGADPSADAAHYSAGLGIRLPLNESHLLVDYAYTDGGPLLAIHRWSVVLPL